MNNERTHVYDRAAFLAKHGILTTSFCLMFALLLPAPRASAQLASTDRADTAAATEQAISTSPSLGRKDVIVTTYNEMLLRLKPATPGMAYRELDDQLRAAQQQFLQTRNACGADTRCLEASYDARIADLRKTIDRYGAVVFDRP